MARPPFRAKYPGVCCDCGQPIRPGALITHDLDSDGYVHARDEDCGTVEAGPSEACPDCGMFLPLSGRCGYCHI